MRTFDPQVSDSMNKHRTRRRMHLLAAAPALVALMAAPAAVGAADAQMTLGKQLFIQTAVPACALCHTLKDAATTGAVGPDLDDLKPDAARVAAALRNGIGSMPSFKDSLTEEQILAVARYVAVASGAAK